MAINKSKTYLLPLLSELVDFDKKFHTSIKNSFIEFDDSKYENCIGILQNFSFKNPEFTLYEHKFIKNELFVELIDIGNQVLYIFKFPNIYINEYNMFKKGKFSKFGEDSKELILEFFGEVYRGNMNAVPFLLKIKQILFKDKKLKKQLERELQVVIEDDAELTDIPDLTKELFKTKEYKK